MAFNENIAARIRTALVGTPNVTEKKMFGGIAFLVAGHMVIGVLNDEIMLRLGNEGTAAALQQPHTRPMDFTGRILKSMLFVQPAGYKTAPALNRWLAQAVAFAQTQPKKKKK